MRLNDPELGLLLCFWLRLALADLRLKVLPFSWNRSWVFNSPDPKSLKKNSTHKASPSAVDMAHAERLIARASSRPLFFEMSCLRRALVLRDYLRRRRGIEKRIIFGTTKEGKNGAATFHAWLDTSSGDGSEFLYTKFR